MAKDAGKVKDVLLLLCSGLRLAVRSHLIVGGTLPRRRAAEIVVHTTQLCVSFTTQYLTSHQTNANRLFVNLFINHSELLDSLSVLVAFRITKHGLYSIIRLLKTRCAAKQNGTCYTVQKR
eukprot:GHVT01008933.1.p2 GENE.GHVT01008933.1~~GHVT01008933.1.p2  ORF type:complete len:121 (-),score=0.36 GHVT01008933.1:1819-2181(-)